MLLPDFNKLLFERRSVRKYSDEPISADAVKFIIEAALLAPSSRNTHPCQFIVVEDKDMLLRLADCKPEGTLPLKSCAMAVCVAVDKNVSSAWVEDASIAATYIQLQAAALGIGSCWVQTRGRTAADSFPSEECIRELLNMPDNLMPLCFITLGIGAETPQPHGEDSLMWEKVHIGSYTDLDE